MPLKNTFGDRRRKTKRRRGGYRGYGSLHWQNRFGDIHWGRGFAGVGSPGEDGSILLPEARLLPRDLASE